MGADDYLTKPFDIRELAARVKSLLRIKRLTEDLEKAQVELINAKQSAAVAAAAVTINHQINSPLTRIIINAELLSSKLPGPSRVKYGPNLKSIISAANNIGELTKKLTQFSNPDFVDYLAGKSMINLNVKKAGE